MNRDDVIKMAREAGMTVVGETDQQCWTGHLAFDSEDCIERFAQLVAAHEREECAKVCDEQENEPECPERARYCADAIRQRGSAD